MNLVEKNIIGFIDSLIVDNYSEAHKFLESIVNEKIKALIKEAKKENPFAEKKKKSKGAKENKVKTKMEDPSDAFKKMQSKADKKDKNKPAFLKNLKKKK